MKRSLLFFFFAFPIMIGGLLVSSLHAQEVDSLYLSRIEQLMDSLERVEKVKGEVAKYEQQLLKKEMSLNLLQGLPVVRGLYSMYDSRKFIDNEPLYSSYNWNTKDYVPASLPLATAWMLKAFGVKSRSKLNRMITANGLALLMSEGIVWGLKHTVDERRPDGRDTHSFPSGHSSLAFVGAIILDREFGHLSPWISVGGYTVATGTQMLRLRHHAHYVHDVAMGAAVGVLSTNLAYFLTDRIIGERGINRPRLYKGDVVRFGRFLEQPTSISVYSGMEFGAKKVDDEFASDNTSLRLSSTFSVGADYSCFIDSHWAAEGAFRLSTTGIQQQPDNVGSTLNQYHAGLGVKYSMPVGLSQRVSFRLLAGERYTEHVFSIPSRWDFESGGGVNISILDTNKYVVGFNIDYIHSFSRLCRDRWFFASSWRILL